MSSEAFLDMTTMLSREIRVAALARRFPVINREQWVNEFERIMRLKEELNRQGISLPITYTEPYEEEKGDAYEPGSE